MSRNILLAGGCSYTDPNFNRSVTVPGLDCSFPKWPELLAKKFNLLFIPFLLQDVALNPELNLSDGIHPNEKGVKIISNTISKKLITILKN